MGAFKTLKRITTLAILLAIGVWIFKYWDNVDGYFTQIKDKYQDFQEVSEVVKDIGNKVAGAKIRELTILTSGKEINLDVEIAESEKERIEGLMGRENLCDDCGMLFIFSDETTSGFWMKNCLIPLDIIFTDDKGKIIDIKKDFDICNENECPSYSPVEPYRYAIEVNAGWTDKNNVEKGDFVIGITSGS